MILAEQKHPYIKKNFRVLSCGLNLVNEHGYGPYGLNSEFRISIDGIRKRYPHTLEKVVEQNILS